VDYCAQFQAFQQQNMVYGAQPFNYTDQLDGLPRSSLNYRLDLGDKNTNGLSFTPNAKNAACVGPYCGATTAFSAGAFAGAGVGMVANDESTQCSSIDMTPEDLRKQYLSTAGVYQTDAGGNDPDPVQWADAANAGAGSAGCDSCSIGNCPSLHCSPARAIAAVVTESSRSQNCWGNNPVVCAKLLLNGQDRFSERLGSYFDLVQPFQHHTATPATGINVYSFALRPEEHQPSGTCNFSRIDNASIQMVVSANTVWAGGMANVRVYATNYNVLRIMSGMGGLAYSN
jgi:hypothetical protein